MARGMVVYYPGSQSVLGFGRRDMVDIRFEFDSEQPLPHRIGEPGCVMVFDKKRYKVTEV